MKNLIPLFFILLMMSCTSYSEKQWQTMQADFEVIPISARPNPLWFWNDSEVKPNELKKQMSSLKEAGYGGVSILPFGKGFEPKYLTDEYFERYRVCVEEAKKLGLSLWIYDEYGFPSGTAGDINGDGVGRFKLNHPEHTNKRLDMQAYNVKEKSTFNTTLGDSQIMAVVAMDTVSFQRIDLKEKVVDKNLEWQVPEGNWKVMVFSCVDAGNTVIDYMSQEAAQLYINMTHDQYYKRFGDYFGSTILGTFFDEPTLYYAEGRSWTPKFNEKFEATHGFSPALYYPALWYNIGEETAEARNYMFGMRTTLYAEGYIKQVNDWSKERGILATGHQDNEEILNCVGTSGDLMKCFKYLDIPGIDKIGGHNRPAEKYYKVVSSAAHNWDHPLVMSETYGAMGNISWDLIFDIAMDQYSKGINHLIPHAAWYNTDKVVFLPELSLRNPIYADSLPALTDYLARLNVLMQNDGRWVGDVAVLYPIHTIQSGHYLDGPLDYYRGGVEIPDLDYIDVGVALSDTLGYDFMFLHPEVLDEQCNVENNQLKLNNKLQYNTFSTLIVPSCKTISLDNLKKISSFANAGGTVIFTTQLPSQATLRIDDAAVASLVAELKSNANVSFIEAPSANKLKTEFDKHPEKYSLKFANNTPVRNIHKVHEGKNIWFFANPEVGAKALDIELNGKYDLAAWDPHTGTISEEGIKISHKNKATRIEMTIDTHRSLFLVEK